MKILIAAFAALISMPAYALVDAAECAAILEKISYQYVGRGALKGAVTYCSGSEVSIDYGIFNEEVQLDIDILKLGVQDQYRFFALAGFYNTANLVELDLTERQAFSSPGAWTAVVGRFEAVLFNAPGALLQRASDTISFSWPDSTPVVLNIVAGNKADLADINIEFDSIRYNHLWGWLASLSRMVEWSLIQIQKHVIGNWGWSVLLFAVLIKVLLLPIAVITVRAQRRVSQYKAVLAPRLLAIKKNFDGAEAHERIMGAHKALGITPFYTLTPLLASLIQIPVLVAVFNALGEMPQFNGESFLWIENLAYPDVIGELPFALPMFGDKISLLPFIMAAITILSTALLRNPLATVEEVGHQKYGLYFLSIGFFVLFYPFPAVMVLYWTFTNMLHIVQQRLIKI